VTPLIGARATETAIKGKRAPRVLHIATHGFFLHDQTLQRRPPGGLAQIGGSGSVFGPSLSTENPLLRSGLALAGANRRESGAQDGILTALEVAGLDLWGTELVVLSACDTGRGKVVVGEGVYGLRRALVIAGAESQLVSLWEVDDEATRELMEAYYARLAAGEGRSEALRRVQLEMLGSEEYSHPYYWASFIPIGAWGPIEGPTGAAERPPSADDSRPPRSQAVAPAEAATRS
jgi:CHAT domain-containing protein